MNGTIDLSSPTQGFSDKILTLDNTTRRVERQYDEDYSWSEVSDSCSCSSCSTCSLCDICVAEDFYENVENETNSSLSPPEGGFIPQGHTIQRRFPLSLQEDYHTLHTSKCEDPDQPRNGLFYSSKSSSKKKSKYNTGVRNTIDDSSEQPTTALEPSYIIYSSGSDKEMNGSFSSSVNLSIIKNADSSSEVSSSEHFSVETEKRKKQVKKVTFVDAKMSSTEGSDRDNFYCACRQDSACSRLAPCASEGDILGGGTQNPVTVQARNCTPFQEDKEKITPPTKNGKTVPNKDKKLATHTDSNKKLVSEYKRLQNILSNIDPFALHSSLQHKLEKKDPQTLLALGKLFPKKSYPLDTIHCVRCHKEYNPRFGKTRCELPHPINSLMRLCKKDQLACYCCAVCRKEYWVNILEDDVSKVRKHLGYCYIGTHTPMVNEVSYFPRGAAKSCEDMGCIEFYV